MKLNESEELMKRRYADQSSRNQILALNLGKVRKKPDD